MRIKVNDLCVVCTDGDTKGYVRQTKDGPISRPEITVGCYRLRLQIPEAAQLAASLQEAVVEARKHSN